jgi:two-component sensor histidine kinase
MFYRFVFLLISVLTVTKVSGQETSVMKVDSLLKLLAKTENLFMQQDINFQLAGEISNGYQSLKYSTRSLQLATLLNDKRKMANSYIEQGNDYVGMNDYENASRAVYNAFKLYEELDNSNGCGTALNVLGNICFYRCKYEEASPYYKKALATHLALKDSEQVANDYLNLGEVYRKRGLLDSALLYLSEAEKISLKLPYELGIAYSLENIGLIHFVMGNKEIAQKKLFEAKARFLKLNMQSPISEFNIELAKNLLKKGDNNTALKFALEAYETAVKYRLKRQLRDASEILSAISERKKDPASAMRHLKEYHLYKDSLLNEEGIQKINTLQMDFELTKKDEQLYKVSTTNKRNFIFAVTLGVIVLLIGLLSFYLFRLNKRLKRANDKLENQSIQLNRQKQLIEDNLKEKEVLLKEIHHRVKNNLQIISSLLNLQSNTLVDEKLIEIFQKGQSRIQSIALIHQKLYQNEEITVINIKEYAEQLALKLIDSLALDDKCIKVKVIASDISLDIDTAVPLGLIINELITNSIKYAFPNDSNNEIHMEIVELKNHYYKLHYSDTGKGLPEEFNLECFTTLGSKLLSILTRQLGGQISYYNEEGANFIITFYDLVRAKDIEQHGKN